MPATADDRFFCHVAEKKLTFISKYVKILTKGSAFKVYKGKLIIAAAIISAALTVTACGNSSDDNSKSSTKAETKATAAESVESAEESKTESLAESVTDTSTVPDTDMTPDSSVAESETTYSEYDSITPEPSTVKISSDWTDLEFVVDGTVFKLGVSAFGDLWNAHFIDQMNTYEDAMRKQSDYIPLNQELPHWQFFKSDEYGYLSDFDTYAYFSLMPVNDGEIQNNVITAFEVDNTSKLYNKFKGNEINMITATVSGKITFGSTADDIITAYGEPDVREDVDNWECLDDFRKYGKMLSNPSSSSSFTGSKTMIDGVTYINGVEVQSEAESNEENVVHREYKEEDFHKEIIKYSSGNKEITFVVSDLVGVCKITIKQDVNEKFE